MTRDGRPQRRVSARVAIPSRTAPTGREIRARRAAATCVNGKSARVGRADAEVVGAAPRRRAGARPEAAARGDPAQMSRQTSRGCTAPAGARRGCARRSGSPLTNEPAPPARPGRHRPRAARTRRRRCCATPPAAAPARASAAAVTRAEAAVEHRLEQLPVDLHRRGRRGVSGGHGRPWGTLNWPSRNCQYWIFEKSKARPTVMLMNAILHARTEIDDIAGILIQPDGLGAARRARRHLGHVVSADRRRPAGHGARRRHVRAVRDRLSDALAVSRGAAARAGQRPRAASSGSACCGSRFR